MKRKLTYALASSILTLALSAFPHYAAASSTTPSSTTPQSMRARGDRAVKYMDIPIIVAVGLLSALLP